MIKQCPFLTGCKFARNDNLSNVDLQHTFNIMQELSSKISITEDHIDKLLECWDGDPTVAVSIVESIKSVLEMQEYLSSLYIETGQILGIELNLV